MADKDQFLIRVWGTRGSIATPGPDTVKYGGNTSCVEVRCGNTLLIFDAGTGLRGLGNMLLKQMPVEAHLLLSHLHWDHIQGFPFYMPIYVEGNQLDIYGEPKCNLTFQNIFRHQMSSPYFPVTFDELPSKVNFHEVEIGDDFTIAQDIRVQVYRAFHPNDCISFRVTYKDKVFVYVTDAEMKDHIMDQNLVEASQDADCLFCDSMFTREQYVEGWGHMTWDEAVELAKAANVKQLILWHHNQHHTDADMDRIEKQAQQLFKNSIAAFEGMEINLL